MRRGLAIRGNYFLVTIRFVAGAEFVDGAEHFGSVHCVHLKAFADGAEQRDGELTAEVFAEFLKAFEDDQLAVLGFVHQILTPQ